MTFKTKQMLVTVISAILVGISAHLFIITNVLKNHDNMSWMTGCGMGITSGRWVIGWGGNIVERLWGNLNLPTFNSMLAVILLAFASYIIVLIFDLQDLVLCGLWSAIFITFPTVASTLVYSFTVHYYALAVLLTVTGVYVTVRYKYGFLVGAFFSACALGTYQAYFPMMISLFVTLLIYQNISENISFYELIKRSFLYLGTLILSLIEYFLILKLALKRSGLVLDSYQNINSMGKTDIHEIPQIISDTYRTFFTIPLSGYYDMSNTLVIRWMIVLLTVFSVCLLSYIVVKKRVVIFKQTKGLLFVFLLLYPLAINSIMLMCYHSDIYTLMIYSGVLIYFLPILVFQQWSRMADNIACAHIVKKVRLLLIVFLSLIALNYCWQDNANYTVLYYANQQTYNYWNSVVTQIKCTEGFNTDLKWAFVGDVVDPLFENPWAGVADLYGGVQAEQLNVYSRKSYITQILGYNPIFLNEAEINSIRSSDSFNNMPTYPNYGSIIIDEDKVIVKFS